MSAFAQETLIEASAVVAQGKDLFITGDENSSGLWKVTDAGTVSVVPFEISSFKQEPQDIEGLARFGEDKFLLLTSMSLTKKGKYKAERDQLTVLKLTAHQTLEAQASISLRSRLLDHLEGQLGEKIDRKIMREALPDLGGLNVEGLAYSCGTIYLGLRSPVTKSGEAIIVPLTGFGTPSEKLLPPFLVSIGGRGVRGLEETHGCGMMVLSGPTGDAHKVSFALGYFAEGTYVINILRDFQKLLRPEGLTYLGDELIFVQDFEAGESDAAVIRIKI